MRVLMVHHRYLQRGGEDVSTETEVACLRAAGHDVVFLEESSEGIAEIGIVSTAVRTVWSRTARSRVDAILAESAFDVLHVQNFFPLISPSVYGAARRRGVAVVQSLRNFRLLCPSATLYRKGAVCEDCVGRRFAWPGVRRGCYRDSRAASTAVATMAGAHAALGTLRSGVDVFIAPSHFARSKFVEAGWTTERIEVKPNGVHPDPGPGSGLGGFALYVGRLDTVKGVTTLLDAWRRSTISLPLKIVGDGPLLPMVREAAATDPRIEVLGPLPEAEAYALMGSARFTVVPSLWYETFGRVVAESFATGTPVIASALGALPELVDHGVNGLLVEPGDAAHLQLAVEHLAATADIEPMRRAARATFDEKLHGEAHIDRLVAIYELALQRQPVGAR